MSEFKKSFGYELTEKDFEKEEFSGIKRRTFLEVMGASMALAGVAGTGCIRKPVQKILPYYDRPEDLIPGKPLFYATSAYIGGAVTGLIAESQDGRPTKLEGNPKHPASAGAAGVWAQAEVLNLYDPDRSKTAIKGGVDSSVNEVLAYWTAQLSGMKASGGAGLALVTEDTPSPTYRRLLFDFAAAYPSAKLYLDDPRPEPEVAGFSKYYDLSKAAVVVALDADILGTDGDMVRNSKGFAARRKVEKAGDDMNRLYAVEPYISITGMMADNRLRLKAGKVGIFLSVIARHLFAGGLAAPAGAEELVSMLPTTGLDSRALKWAVAIAKDLAENPGDSAIAVGARQPATVRELARLINVALGNIGKSVNYVADASLPASGGLAELAADIDSGAVKSIVIIGGNPAYNSTGDLGLRDKILSVENTLHCGLRFDETAEVCRWHIPRTHFLESWGDLRSACGTDSLVQPLIAPLYSGISEIELLSSLLGGSRDGHALIQAHWKEVSGVVDFDKSWRRWLHDGVILASDAEAADDTPIDPALMDFSGLRAKLTSLVNIIPDEEIEVNFLPDPKVYDGRYANNAWLQENPSTISKVTWDNVALMSNKTAAKIEAKSGETVWLKLNGEKVELPLYTAPGVADNTVTVTIGYGRPRGGRVAAGVGVNVNPLRSSKAPFIASGAELRATKRCYQTATVQEHEDMLDRPFVREATLAEYRKEPTFVLRDEIMPPEKIHSLWEHPNNTEGHQWGMTFDLNLCTGCSACQIACTAENNIPVVGKERIQNGRELHWMRIDRYWDGEDDDAKAQLQPVACAHCETAPCENVCPVAATTHSPDGLNDMAYNRCIGTRYCSNNCPFKVRRFNYFNFSKENNAENPMWKFQTNPDVTVRFRGVMEKCSYCVQRISEAKIAAKRDGNGVVPDGAIVTACQQTCPTGAITFGDVNNSNSVVSKTKAQDRNYVMLAELNIHPRTSYLAKLRNPNPELV